MDFRYFFIYSKQIEERQLYIGFNLYDTGHIIWLAAIAAAAAAAGLIYRKATVRSRTKAKKIFALVLLALEILKDTVLAVSGANMIDYLPLHLCSFTIFVMLLHSFGHWQQITGQMMAYAMFPGAVAALLFCNWTEYPFLSYMNIHSFVFHGWIVIYFIMLYMGGEIKANYAGLWKTAAIMFIVAIPVYIFNLIFGTNYLFLNEASAGSPLVIVWDLLGSRFGAPGYLVGIVLMVIIIFHLLYVIYKILDMIRSRKRGI